MRKYDCHGRSWQIGRMRNIKVRIFTVKRRTDHKLDAVISEVRSFRSRRWIAGIVLFVTAILVSGGYGGISVASVVAASSGHSVVGESAHTGSSVVAHWLDLTTTNAGLPSGAQVVSLVQYDGHYVAAGDYFGIPINSGAITCPGGECNPVVWTSVDGNHWRIAFARVARGSVANEQLVITPAGLMLFGADESTALWRTANLKSWFSVRLPSMMSALSLTSAVWGHGRMVALISNKYAGGPNHAYGESDSIWTSIRGTNWHKDRISGLMSFHSLAQTDFGFIAGGILRSSGASAIWRSLNGITWLRTKFDMSSGELDVGSHGNIIVAEVAESHGVSAGIWQSINGEKWTSAKVIGGPIPAPEFGPTPLFATSVGMVFASATFERMWSSSTGRVWSPVTVTGLPSGKNKLQGFFPNREGGLFAIVVSANSSIRIKASAISLWRIDFK